LAKRIALTHHERWDGSGYPLGLAGEDIPLEGRITAVADVFDVLAHPRPHKKAWPLEKAVQEIIDQAGRQFDPEVVGAFRRLDARSLLEPVVDQIRRVA
jgi:putative two-component system response regulator